MSSETLQVHILGKDYQVACPPDERDALLAAAAELDRRMRDIRQQSSVIGVERIAIMAALNLAHELNQNKQAASNHEQEYLDQIHQRLDNLLS